MTLAMAREQAAAAVAGAAAEHDDIQANLLDLDGSFGKRMLERQRQLAGTQGPAGLSWPRGVLTFR